MAPSFSKRKKFAKPFSPAHIIALCEKYHDGNYTEMARHLGLPQSTLWNLTSGSEQAQPRAETIELIARTYHVTMEFVYGVPAKAQADTFASGVLHAITVVRGTLEQLNATRDLQHLRESMDPTRFHVTGEGDGSAAPAATPPIREPLRAAKPGERTVPPSKKGAGKKRA